MKNLMLLLLAIFISSCTSFKVVSDYDNEINFNNFQTYELLLHKSDFPVEANPINKNRLEKGIHENMAALNFKESENPDLFVTYFVKKENRESDSFYRNYYNRLGNNDQHQIIEYKVGTLVIDFIDAKKKQVVWHGAISRAVNEDMKNAEKRINENVKTMFDKFVKESGIGA